MGATLQTRSMSAGTAQFGLAKEARDTMMA